MPPSAAQLEALAVGRQPAPPAAEGNDLATTHGAYSPRAIGERAALMVDDLRSRVPAYTSADEHTVVTLAQILARCQLAYEELDRKGGIVDRKGRPLPVLKILSTWENSAARLMRDLGMTPTSRMRMGLDIAKTRAVVDAATALSEPDPERRRVLMELAGLDVHEEPAHA